MKSSLINHNVVGMKGRTSIGLEPLFWEGLDQIGRQIHQTRNEIVRDIQQAQPDGTLTGAVRVYVLRHFMEQTVPNNQI